jgi:hypothetical protein
MTLYPPARYEVWIGTPTGSRLALLDTISALSYIQTLNGIGRWSLTLPSSIDASLILPDRMVEIWRSVGDGPLRLEMAGLVDGIDYSDTGGVDLITLSGRDGNGLLDGRIVAYPAGSSQASKTDNADDMMKAIVRENLGASASAARDLSAAGVSVAADLGLGPSVTKKFSWKNVLQALKDIADSAQQAGTPVYFQMKPNVLSATQIGWVFVTAVNRLGADRTYASGTPTVFGKEWGNLDNPRLSYDWGDERTVVYAAGQGEGSDRVQATVEDTARSGRSVWARREVFQDARNEETSTAVTSRANETLNASRPKVRFTGDLKDTAQTRYGVDWQFGDLVTATYAGKQFDGSVSGVQIGVRASGETITARVEVEQ